MNPQEPIPGCIVKPLARRPDARGVLTELFRIDELPEGFRPAMSYLSVTHPGIARGPHEHLEQTDGFGFIDGSYELYLWENRPGMPSKFVTLKVGMENPVLVLVPPGVVHAYKNVGSADAFVLNFPDKLFAGWGRAEPIDEVRHESDPDSPFKLP